MAGGALTSQSVPVSGGRVPMQALALSGLLAIAGLAYANMDLLGEGFSQMASGRWILAHHAVPRGDPFSFASARGSWLVDAPGSSVLFALVAEKLSLRALLVVGTLVELAAVGLLWLRSARTLVARALLLPLALYFVFVDRMDLSVRPELFGDLAFVLLLGVLARLRDRKSVHPALVVVFAAAWANLGDSFLLLLVLPLLAAALLFLERPVKRPRVLPFLLLVPLSAVGALLNPYGARLLAHAFLVLAGPARSPDLHDAVWLLALALGTALALVRGRVGERGCKMPEQIFVLAFVAAACVSRRFVPFLVAVEIGLLGPMLDVVLARRQLPSLTWGVVPFALALGGYGLTHGHDPLRNAPAAAAVVARDAAEELVREGKGMDRVVDPVRWGGYLAYAWNGEPKYFEDGRDPGDLFANGVSEDGAALEAGKEDYEEILDAYEAGVVLCARGRPLDAKLQASPSWVEVHADPVAVVYVRKGS